MYNPYQYVPGSSLVHKLDPRTKIITVIAFSLVIMQVKLISLLAAAAFIVLCSQLSRIPAARLLNTLRPVMPFFIFLFIIYIFFTAGTPLISLGPVQITSEGLAMGVLQVGKFILLVLAASVLTISTSATTLTMGLERLLRPLNKLGGSSYDIAMMVTLALRFLPTLLEEMNNINEAQLSRNSNLSSLGLKGKIRSIVYLSLPLTLNFLRCCDELADAMEARCYRHGVRTFLYELHLTPMDYYLIIMVIITTVLCLIYL